MNAQEYEVAVKRVRDSQQAKEFLPFYRNALKPLLEHSVIEVLANENTLTDRELIRCQAYTKMIRDMELLLTRLILMGESVEKVLKGGKQDANTGGV